MSMVNRLQKEKTALTKHSNILRNLNAGEDNILKWSGCIVPQEPPYNKGAFKIEIEFPADYPFKPPKLTFKTPIFHPNIGEKGQICLPIIANENWKPTIKIEDVILALVDLLYNPDTDHPLRTDVAEIYLKEKKRFIKEAEEQTINHAEKIPSL